MFFGVCNVLQIPENFAIRKVLELAAPQHLNVMYVGCLVLLLGISIKLVCGKRAEVWLDSHGKTTGGLFCLAALFIWAVISLSQVSTFLYFNF